MGKVMSLVRHKMGRFNVENRAHKFLERDKLAAAPKFDGNIEDMKRALDLDPELIKKLNRKDADLDNRLKKVYVTSEETFIDYASKREVDPTRPLPSNRTVPEYFEYGYQEPRRILHGRCTLRQALKFITDHQEDSSMWTAKKIADDYKLKEQQVAKILLYFKAFNIHIPDIKVKDSLLTQARNKLLSQKDDSPPT